MSGYLGRTWLGVTLMTTGQALASESLAIQLNIEEPKDGRIYQGVANLRGWAVAPIDLEGVEIYLDRVYLSNAPLGGNRPDVARDETFGQYPNAAFSGFSLALNYGDYEAGEHVLTVRAIDVNGDYRDRTLTFEIVSFPNPYLVNDLDSPTVRVDQPGTQFVSDIVDGFCIQGAIIEGTSTDICLRWRNETQDFAIESIVSGL